MADYSNFLKGSEKRKECQESCMEFVFGMGESRVMFRWTSSLWKLLWRELLVYTLSFLGISAVYRLGLNTEQQLLMEKLIRWCRAQSTGVPITFLLGFYVSLVVKRWWEQYCKLPWPDTIAIYLKGLVIGTLGQKRVIARVVRRTVMRYCLLSYILCIRRFSSRLKKRFPDMQELVKTGIVRADEVKRIGQEENLEFHRSNWWLPLKWSIEVITSARDGELIKNPPGYSHLIGKLCEYRNGLTEVSTYAEIPVPLVYTQVVHLAVYVYFAVSLIGEQWLIWRQPGDEEVDLYYPVFMTVRFLFIFGWLRVAETLYNPFGEDDEDFELNELLNRHFRVAMSIVDDYEEPPELQKDIFWNSAEPELIEHPEIIDIQDAEKIEVQVKQECNNIFHHQIINGGCKDTLL